MNRREAPTVTDMVHDSVYITAFREAMRIIDASEGDMDFAKFKINNRIKELYAKFAPAPEKPQQESDER